eukprot:SAG11_NODE_33676_length_276_cov_0.570621_1_plen_80_part_01
MYTAGTLKIKKSPGSTRTKFKSLEKYQTETSVWEVKIFWKNILSKNHYSNMAGVQNKDFMIEATQTFNTVSQIILNYSIF